MPSHAPVYLQVREALRDLALSHPLDSPSPLPAEGELVRRFGVSRGTLRRATGDLVQEGLLSSEPGRGTFVVRRVQVRLQMAEVLARIAHPDSRWHLDFSAFVPDFTGSSQCHRIIRARAEYVAAQTVFVAPDNSLQGLIAQALDDGKQVLVPTYGMRRGMVLLTPAMVPAAARDFASTLDGVERFGQTLSLDELAALPGVDLLVTGGIAFTTSGVHIGTGRAYLDLEWGLLAQLRLVRPDTPVIGVVHDDQVLTAGLSADPLDLAADVIITPSGAIPATRASGRPGGIAWDYLDADRLTDIAYLADLRSRSPLPVAVPMRTRR